MNHPLLALRRVELLPVELPPGERRREATILSVSRDPGQNIVFLGYGPLVLGMCVVLGDAHPAGEEDRDRSLRAPGAARRRDGGEDRASSSSRSPWSPSSRRGGPRGPEAGRSPTIRTLPVQHDGRVMPLDTLAREAVWKVTGFARWQGQDPVSTVLGWTFDPNTAANAPVVDLAATSPTPAASPAALERRSCSGPDHRVMRLMRQAHDDEMAEKPGRHGL